MKQIFTLALVLLAFAAQAARPDSPFGMRKMHPQVEKLIKDTRIYLTDAQLRIAASSFPDSAISYGWDGAAWELETQVRINYTNFSRISSLIFYFDAGGMSIPIFRYEYTYDAAGRTTRIEQLQTIPGTPPATVGRFTMNYDAQGNQTSMLFYQDDNGTLAFTGGDSLQITYSGGVPSVATRYTWDENGMTPAWLPEVRYTNLTFGSNGHPTAVTINYWDNNTFTEEERITELSWKMGYPGFSIVFGGLIDISEYLFTELPTSMAYYGEPTDYLGELKNGSSWELSDKLVSTGPVGAITQIVQQTRSGSSWVDEYRATLSYTSGRITTILNEVYGGSSWSPQSRDTYAYDAQGNLTSEISEYHSGGNWVIGYGNQHTFSYTPDNKVYRWIGQEWDSFSMSYENYVKRDYFFGSFPLSAPVNKLAALQVYPNPVQDVLNIALESAVEGKLTLQLFNLQGQLVTTEVFTLNQGKNELQLDVQTLAKGLYQLRLQTANGMETVRFVK